MSTERYRWAVRHLTRTAWLLRSDETRSDTIRFVLDHAYWYIRGQLGETFDRHGYRVSHDR